MKGELFKSNSDQFCIKLLNIVVVGVSVTLPICVYHLTLSLTR